MSSEKFAERVVSRAELIAEGFTPRGLTAAVRTGRLRRLRRDHYVAGGVDDDFDVAVRVGGRLTCLSLLAMLGVFVLEPGRIHLHIDRRMSRLRSTHTRFRRLGATDRLRLMLHWSPLRHEEPSRHHVGIVNAVLASVRCQPPRASIATLDSIVHLGLLTMAQLRDAFQDLPDRYAVLLHLVDGRCESGPESLLRLLLRQTGAAIDIQKSIPGVGRVDFMLDGWLIVECDSRAHHDGWAAHRHDRRRDLAAAALGYTTIRPIAQDIIHEPEQILRAVRGLLASR